MTKRTTTEADRQTARYTMLTPGDVAARLGEDHINADTVRSWIDAPDGLQAVDLRRTGANRPAWFTTWDWVEAFMERRTKNAA